MVGWHQSRANPVMTSGQGTLSLWGDDEDDDDENFLRGSSALEQGGSNFRPGEFSQISPFQNPCGFCSERFPLPLCAWDGLRYFNVALPEPSI